MGVPQSQESNGGPSIPRIKRGKTKNGDLRGSKPLPQFPSKDSVENVAKVHTQCCSRCLRGSFQQPGKGRFFNWAVRFLISCQKLNLLVQWTPLIKPKKPPSFSLADVKPPSQQFETTPTAFKSAWEPQSAFRVLGLQRRCSQPPAASEPSALLGVCSG